MVEECNRHTNLRIDDKHTGGGRAEVFIICLDCDGAWELTGDVNNLSSNIRLSPFMLSMPDQANRRLPDMRRKRIFSFLWEQTDMNQIEVISLIREREDDFIEEYGIPEVPEWILRLEAQDQLIEFMYDKLGEEGFIEA